LPPATQQCTTHGTLLAPIMLLRSCCSDRAACAGKRQYCPSQSVPTAGMCLIPLGVLLTHCCTKPGLPIGTLRPHAQTRKGETTVCTCSTGAAAVSDDLDLVRSNDDFEAQMQARGLVLLQSVSAISRSSSNDHGTPCLCEFSPPYVNSCTPNLHR
jgi:hypothetical protein